MIPSVIWWVGLGSRAACELGCSQHPPVPVAALVPRCHFGCPQMSSRAVLTSLLRPSESGGVVTASRDRAQDLLTHGSTRQLTSEAGHKWGAAHSLFTFASY